MGLVDVFQLIRRTFLRIEANKGNAHKTAQSFMGASFCGADSMENLKDVLNDVIVEPDLIGMWWSVTHLDLTISCWYNSCIYDVYLDCFFFIIRKYIYIIYVYIVY